MAVVMPNSIFVHIPRCRGQWLRKVLGNMYPEKGKRKEHREGRKAVHESIKDVPDDVKKNRMSFGFVRHPLDWVKSRWSHKHRFGVSKHALCPLHVAYNDCHVASSLEETIQNITILHPGLVSRMMFHMVGECDVIGRMEDDSSFMNIIRMCHEPLRASHLDVPIINSTSTNPELDFTVSAEVLKDFMSHETWLMDTWYNHNSFFESRPRIMVRT